MSTITLPNIRVGSDLQVKVRLKDGGVAIDWTTLTKIRAHIYSDAQRALAGRCDVSVDAEDPTLLVCDYAATKPQYLGVTRIIVQATYLGEMKTYDKPAFNFVRWTDDQEGESIQISDPDIDVEISVEDVTSSILQNILDACIKATEEAREVVDTSRGPRGYSAYEIAVQDGFEGTEEEWLESLQGETGPQGPQGEQGIQGETGPQGIQGNTGSSVAYPYELVNNRTTDDATKGLSAAEGKRLGDDLSQLEAKLNNLAMTRYYGFFPTAGDLPANASELGYAYVGSTAPFAIYEFDGEDWTDTEATINGVQGEPGVGFESVASPTPADGTFLITLTNGDTITVDMNHEHPQYYSKLVETSQPQGGFLPDVIYKLGTITGSVTFALAAAVTGNANHYFIVFETGSTAPTIVWPSGLTWVDGSAPAPAANKHYEVSIMDGIAAYLEV